jgi:hypothetical protein
MLEKPTCKEEEEKKGANSPSSPSTFGQPPPGVAWVGGGELVIGESFCGGESNEVTWEARLANGFRVVVIY